MAKKKSPINASTAELIAIGNEAFNNAAKKARAAGHRVTYSDRHMEMSEYIKNVLSYKNNAS